MSHIELLMSCGAKAANANASDNLYEVEDPQSAQYFCLTTEQIATFAARVTAAPQEGVSARHKDRSDSDTNIDADNPLLTPAGPESPQPLAPPPGYALVPLEPTAEMLNADGVDSGEKTARKTYIAMVAAAPQPPASALPDTGNVGAIPEPSDDEVDLLLAEIDQIARDHDGEYYGLPTWENDRMQSMRAQVNWFFGRWVAAALPPPGRGMVPMSVDWEAVGRILEAHHAMQGQFIPGTSNWGAAIWKAALGIKEGS